MQERTLLALFLVLLCVRLCATSNSLLLDRDLLSVPPCHLRPVGTANEIVAVTDVASQAPNMMIFVGNLKATSQASVESTARSPLRVQAGWVKYWVGFLGSWVLEHPIYRCGLTMKRL